MTLEVAFILLVLDAAGLVLIYKFLQKESKIRKICLVLLSLIAVALVLYIGVSLYFIDAVRNQPADF